MIVGKGIIEYQSNRDHVSAFNSQKPEVTIIILTTNKIWVAAEKLNPEKVKELDNWI